MKIETQIREKLTSAFTPLHLELVNESHMHAVPRGSETHFRLVLVTERFQNLSRVARSRLVYECLDHEMNGGGVHALAQRLYAPAEWTQMGGQVDAPSPKCLGGSKGEKTE